MSSFCERLYTLMENTGIGTDSIAKLLNISEQQAENIVTGYSEPDIDILSRLTAIFNVSKDYIVGISGDPKTCEDDSVKEIFVVSHFNPGDTIITAGNIAGSVYMNRKEMHGKDYYALIAKDDSMSKARIFKGDILIVRRQDYADNSDVVVAMVGNDTEIVRRYKRSGNIVTLAPEGDSMKYKTLKIDILETPLTILGKVCEVRMQNI